jgi:hypothetical protein
MKSKNKAGQELAKKRHQSLTPERRSEIARQAALARWAKQPVQEKKNGQA